MSATKRQQSPEQRRRQAIITAISLVVIAAVVAVTWVINNRGSDDQTSTAASASKSRPHTSTQHRSTTRTTAQQPANRIPARVTRTLALIDAGDWPDAANAPGTRGGIAFANREGRLPTSGADNRRIRYQEWDVNPKRAGQSRDAERIVTGSDGSAWYTVDHYRTFVMIRGPST